MKINLFAGTVLALFLSVGAQAQNQPDVHKAKIHPTPDQRIARKLDHKAQMANMTPAERKAFKQTHRDQRQTRLNVMTPERRAKIKERHRLRKTIKRAGK